MECVSPGCHSRQPAGSICAPISVFRNTTLAYGRRCREPAMVKHKQAVLFRVVFALRRQITDRMRRAVDLAVFEQRLAIAKNEIDVPFDVAMRKILPRWSAMLAVRSAAVLTP